MTPQSISPITLDLISKIEKCRGQYIRARFTSIVKPAAASKHHALSKITEGAFRSGIDYANLKQVKEGIASGDRGEVESLPWGEWLQFPWVIGHKDTEYLRLYPVEGQKMNVIYIVDGQTVDKEQFQEHLTASQKFDGPPPACITKKISEIDFLGCWENPEVSNHDCCE